MLKRTIIIDIEVEDDREAMTLASRIAKHDSKIVKVNVYEPPQGDRLDWRLVQRSREFVRHIGAVGGKRYGS